MNETAQKLEVLSVFVYDAVFVSEEITTEIVILGIVARDYPSFSPKEIAGLRKVLLISIGVRANELTEEDLREFGASMLQVTAIVLKAKYSQRKVQLETIKINNYLKT